MPDGLIRAQPGLLMTTDAVGGVWRYSLDLGAGFVARGVPTTLAVLGPAPSERQREAARQAGLLLIDTGLPLDWTAADEAALAVSTAALRRMAARAAAVHLHAPALVGSERWPAPVVAVAHSCVGTWWRAVRGGELPEDFRWRTAATAAGLHAADALIAPSAAHAAALRAVYGPLPVHVVRNGRAREPSPSGRGLGEGLSASSHPHPDSLPRGEGERKRLILTAGRLWDEAKNAAALDRVAPALDAPIRAAGPVRGPNGAAIDLPNLELLGELDAMGRAYADASVFASMALYEPFGLAVLEAAQAGMRLVLSDIPSFRELWDDAAIFVGSERELRPALQHALDASGDGGAQVRAARYTVDAMVEGTLAVHRTVRALV